jgi:hypothetical protein
MPRFFSHIVSALFHPFFFPTYATILVVYTHPYRYGSYDPSYVRMLLIIVFLLTFVFPSLALVVMRGVDLIKSFKLENRQQRYIPYITGCVFYLMAFLMFKPGSGMQIQDLLLTRMMFGGVLTIFICMIINLTFKVSLHTTAAAGLMGLILYTAPSSYFNMEVPFLIAIILAGLVGTARLSLMAHEPKEVYVGYLVGLGSMFVAFQTQLVELFF